ncbi:hypothetical protein [Haloarchaeobius sp. TZWSO28]|uniref:hypothetical protein n=1 Tax=Haloarchaeobius sp. TZWSO28 TaxID=3446119 RepID=UPI003EB6DCC8
MQRRVFCAAVASTLAGLTGCTGRLPGDQPGAEHTPPGSEGYEEPTEDRSTPTGTQAVAPDVEVGFEFPTAEEGFAVDVVVTNAGTQAMDAVLVLVWSKDDAVERRRQRVQQDPGEVQTYSFEFEAVGDLSVDWERP